MEIVSTIADVCGIFGFIISLFAINKVYNIKKELKNNNKVNVSDTNIKGDFVGRDKNK
jgi:hypothetical protein